MSNSNSDNNASYSIGIFLFTPSIERYVAEYRELSSDHILTAQASFADAVKVAKEWERQGVEVFISRRGTGDLLRRSVVTPVLSLPFSDMELFRILKTQRRNNGKIMVTVYGESSSGIDVVGELLNVALIQGVYKNYEELDAVVKKARHEKVDLIAGGGATQKLARRYGIPYLELPPSREQVMNILDTARNVAKSNREKEALNHELQCMMNAMADGLISVDCSGKIISVNNAALALLKYKEPEQLIGKSFADHLGEDGFQSLLQGHKTHYEKILDINGVSFISNIALIKSKRTVERLLITLRTSQDVIRQSGSIRSAISRGFVANYRLQDVVHKHPSMRFVLNLCKTYAKTDASVLIHGETGTGKEMVAQGIHRHSSRHKHSFVSLNCAELPEHLLESELFGYDEGAFTGSRKGGRAGFFELAHNGTIFLDEIDSASTSVQSKLLRVLQEKQIMRIGGVRKIPVDARVLTSSGTNLWHQVCKGLFRKDLFFRLNVMSIAIPPLRERIDDIDALLKHFLHEFARRENVPTPPLKAEHLRLLHQYSWPGNVRQLRHFAERYVLHSAFMEDPFSYLYKELHTITLIPSADAPPQQAPPLPGALQPEQPPVVDAAKALETPAALQKVLEQVRYSKQDAARMLGVSRSTLWRKMKQWGMD